MKYYLSSDALPKSLRKEMLDIALLTAREILSKGYVPGKRVESHAMQETFTLAIATCPYLSVEEKVRLLGQPWLLEVVDRTFFGKGKNLRASSRFLRRCFQEVESTLQLGDPTALPTVFRWENDQFDTLLYEKQPQFIY